MDFITRAKNIITSPKTEWPVIATETPDPGKIITGYVLPLAGIAALAAFIGYAFIGYSAFGYKVVGINWGIYQALLVLVGAILAVYLCALVVDMLAPSFGSEKNFGRSLQLVAYSFTPGWVGGILAIYPPLALIGSLFGLYGLYLLYVGLPIMKNTPPDKHTSYFVVTLIVAVVAYIVIGAILGAIFLGVFGLTRGVGAWTY